MALQPWRRLVARPTSIIFLSTIFGVLFIAQRTFFTSPKKNELLDALLAAFIVSYVALLCALIIGFVVYLIKLSFDTAFCYLVAACVMFASTEGSIYASALRRGDRFVFPDASHAEIAQIYRNLDAVPRLVKPGVTNRVPGLIALGDECHPPTGCECWIALDRSHDREIEKDIGNWHRPTSAVFPTNTLPVYFAIVNVKKIDADAFSILGCSADWRAWWLR
jgi:hypothetical protein